MQRFAETYHIDENIILSEILTAENHSSNFSVKPYLEALQDTKCDNTGVYSETSRAYNPISGSSDNFGKYLNPDISPAYRTVKIDAPSHEFSGGSYRSQRTLSTKGALTEGNKAALSEIHKYLEESKVYDALDGLLKYLPDQNLEVALDGHMPPYVMGETNCLQALHYCGIKLNEKLYSKPYTEIGDKNSHMIVKYLQAATLLHEYIHKVTLSSKMFNDAVDNLKYKMKYSDENIRGFLEMYAETLTKKSLAKDKILSHMAKMYSPYKHASDMGELIYEEFKGDGMDGLQRLVYLAYLNQLSKEDGDKYIKPLHVKAPKEARYKGKEQHGKGCAGNGCNKYDHPMYA